MPASVPSRLPASYLWDRILQPPVKRTVSSEKKKDPAETGDPLVLVRWSRNELKTFLQVGRRLGIYFPFRFFFFSLLANLATCLVMCLQFQFVGGNKGGHCEAIGVPQTD